MSIATKCPKCMMVGYCVCENKPLININTLKEKLITWDDVMNSYRETLKTWNTNAFGYLTLENYLKSNFEPPKRIKKINYEKHRR